MSTQETYLKGIADAIRAKTGLTGTIKASQFAEKIRAISTGVAKPEWTQTTLPASKEWKSVCYGGGKFVAVANNSSVAAYSTDGINWTQASMPGERRWSSVCYGGGKFVAVCLQSMLPAYSTDGINWSSGRLPISDWWGSVCYGGGRFVAVNQNATVGAFSDDGVNWTKTTLSSESLGNFAPCCYANGKFVVASWFGVCTSIDGTNWTVIKPPELDLDVESDVYSICYGNGKFVLVNYHAIYYSTDGITWTTKSTGPMYASVCYGNGKFVTVPSESNFSRYLKDSFDEWA